eukprot:CAMPEP_0175952398 /NCGR_PEP_ID=MMETSP0108-20121206/30728_1 /TAXON_ID=195067 ORGANISM="Goniomonas pacifica, Strain CCMP1869" /NCGR_SAMPLE_ID=MMETSP0108 /ASSEMBLY_ACC=CAM_ASM_000204 /LENGTH=49 /DNA_ID=CAMNT_0017278753 /DNA_START=543 /DNA_END=693 /DNA_ORIENTATION=+
MGCDIVAPTQAPTLPMYAVSAEQLAMRANGATPELMQTHLSSRATLDSG